MKKTVEFVGGPKDGLRAIIEADEEVLDFAETKEVHVQVLEDDGFVRKRPELTVARYRVDPENISKMNFERFIKRP